MVAARLRRIDEENGRIIQAWQVVRIYAASMHKKRVPNLSKLLISERQISRRSQTPAEMRSAMRIIAQQYGLKVRKQTPRG